MDTNRSIPRPSLSPKLQRPLQLWNPLDYLRLLYWTFFFPQALRWYVETFTDPRHRNAIGDQRLSALRQDRVQRNLVLQALSLAVLTPPALAVSLQWMGIPVDWFGVAIGVIFGTIYGVMRGLESSAVVGTAAGVAAGLARAVALSTVFGVTSSVTFGVMDAASLDAPGSAAGGAAGGVTLGMALSVMLSVVGGETSGVVFGITRSMTRYMAYSLLGSIVLSLLFGVALGAAFGVTFNVVLIASSLRPVDYLLLAFPRVQAWSGEGWHASRVVFLPLPGVRRRLEMQLAQDWSAGLRDADELLAYTLQFIPVIQAINASMARLPQERLLAAVVELAHEPFDWDLVRFGSASLRNAMWNQAIEGLFVVPRRLRHRWQARFPVEPRLDTPVRAACAGFWHLHEKDPAKAAEAFAVVRSHPGSDELYLIATSLATALEAADTAARDRWLEASAGLVTLPEPHLRPTVLHTLHRLREVAEVCLTEYGDSPLEHTDALERAVYALTQLLVNAENTCAQPEATIVKAIAEQWRNILSSADHTTPP